MILSSMTVTFDNISLEDAIKYLSYVKTNACIRIDGRTIAEKSAENVKEELKEKPKTKAKATRASAEEIEEPADREEDQVVSADATTGKSKKITKVDIRAKAVTLSKAGKKEILRALLDEFGIEKISDLDEADYAAFMRRLEETANE